MQTCALTPPLLSLRDCLPDAECSENLCACRSAHEEHGARRVQLSPRRSGCRAQCAWSIDDAHDSEACRHRRHCCSTKLLPLGCHGEALQVVAAPTNNP